MALDKKTLHEYLACYGANTDLWPENIREIGAKTQHDSEFIDLFREERQFEHVLLKRYIESASDDLAQRIIFKSLVKKQLIRPEWLFNLMSGTKSAALAAILLLGFVIGFGAIPGAMQDKRETRLQSLADDDGAIL